MLVVNRECASQYLFGLIRPVSLQQNEAQLGERIHIVWLKCERHSQFSIGQIIISPGAGSDANEIVSFRRFRKAFFGATKHLERLLELTQKNVGAAQPRVMSEYAVVLLQRSLIKLDRSSGAAMFPESFAQHEVRLRKVWPQMHRAVPEIGGSFILLARPID